MNNVTDKITESLAQDFGPDEPLPEEELRVIDEIEARLKNVEVDEIYITRNYITYGDACGFAQSGKESYVSNSDRNQRYRVTIRTTWRQGTNSGRSNRVISVAPRSRRHLGCTRSSGDFVPVVYYSYNVIGEEPYELLKINS